MTDEFGGTWNPDSFYKQQSYVYTQAGIEHDKRVVDDFNAGRGNRSIELLNGEVFSRESLSSGLSAMRRGGGIIAEDGTVAEADYSLSIAYRDGTTSTYTFGEKIKISNAIGITFQNGDGEAYYGRGFHLAFDDEYDRWVYMND